MNNGATAMTPGKTCRHSACEMNKFKKFALKTVLGPFAIWCGTGLLLCASIAVSPLLGGAGGALVATMCGVQLAAAFVYVAAFVMSLAEHDGGRALAQAFLGLAGLFLFVVGVSVSTLANFRKVNSCGPARDLAARRVRIAAEEAMRRLPVRYASVTNENGLLEFDVEYRPAHPFLAEYDKCVVFPSGRRIGVWMDTGGAGAFAVYRLPTGEYYLVDGLDFDFVRNDYRVNTTNETVEIRCDETWVNIPDETLKIDGMSSGSIFVKAKYGEKSVDGGTPVGDSLMGRVYVGLLYPSGDFEPGTGDPFADIIEPKWNLVKLDGGEVPFSLECRRWKGSRCYRIVFASDSRIVLDSERCAWGRGYSLYALEDGRYHLFETEEKDISRREEWRIDASGETVEVMFKDPWGKSGDLWVKLPPGTISTNRSIGIGGGENGAPLSVSINVNTESGVVSGHDFVPVGDSLSNAKFIGTFQPPDDDPRHKQHRRERR